MMATALRIDFVSDIACPWCVIGLRGLQKALDALGDAVRAEIHCQPFELNPDMGPEGENVAEHVQKKYRSTSEQSAAVRQVIKDRGAELGFTFNYSPDTRIWNTFDAHRLLHWAALEGRQLALKQVLFEANFTDQSATSDHSVLIESARKAGLDPERAREILSTDACARGPYSGAILARARHTGGSVCRHKSALDDPRRAAARSVRAGAA